MDAGKGARSLGGAALLFAVFLDLVGFGMAFPDVQLRAEAFGAAGWLIGVLQASLFVVQFVASPRWGLVSDRIGRKPVLVACTALSALSMLVYAHADNLWWILLSRVLGGLGAANVAVAHAYVTDATQGPARTKALGRVCAAVTAGIMVGPLIGGQLAEAGGNHLLGLVAALFSALGVLVLVVALPNRPPAEAQRPGKPPVFDVRLLRELPALRPLVLLAVVSWFALACLEGTFGRLLEARLEFPSSLLGIPFTQAVGASGAIFSVESLVGVLVQGLVLAWISVRVGRRPLLRAAYLLQGLGLLFTPFVPGLGWILLCSIVYSAGIALANPTVNAACSAQVADERQGELFGMLQGARSIGFLFGPILGGALFDLWPAAPYVLAGAAGVAAALLVPRPTAGEG